MFGRTVDEGVDGPESGLHIASLATAVISRAKRSAEEAVLCDVIGAACGNITAIASERSTVETNTPHTARHYPLPPYSEWIGLDGMTIDDADREALKTNSEAPRALHRICAGSSTAGKRILRSPTSEDNGVTGPFWRKTAWSPDGTHLLAQSDDHHLDLFRLEYQANSTSLHLCFSVRAPTTLLDFAWYPLARNVDDQTWCFAMSARDVTVRLIDAYAGQTRATYGFQNHTERFIGPQALCFSLDGTKLYCGHETSLTTYDLTRPGVNTYLTTKPLSPSKRAVRQGKSAGGQRGCISALAVCMDRSSMREVIAVGTFSGNVAIYETELAAQFCEDACIMGWKEEVSHGISQVAFHPTTPHILFLSSRRLDNIMAYDLRYVGRRRSFLQKAPSVSLLGLFSRAEDESGGRSQQRMFFDLDPSGKALLAGSKDGHVNVWSVDTQADSSKSGRARSPFGQILKDSGVAEQRVLHRWQCAHDAIPSIAIHPTFPLCVVASGSRTWESSGEDSFDVADGALSLYTLVQ